MTVRCRKLQAEITATEVHHSNRILLCVKRIWDYSLRKNIELSRAGCVLRDWIRSTSISSGHRYANSEMRCEVCLPNTLFPLGYI